MQTRDFLAPFALTDVTQELLLVPNTWGLINQLGIFSDQSVSQHSITVESTNGTLGVISDQVRGSRAQVNKDEVRTLRSFAIPHFPLDDYITPNDIQGKRKYGSTDQAEVFDDVLARKLARIRMSHAITLETARANALVNGTIYAPNGTVSGNFYTDFGVTQKVVNYALTTPTTELKSKVTEVTDHIQDNILSGEVITDYVALCSPEFFDSLVTHATVKEAYKYYSSTQEPLRQRLGGDAKYEQFTHQGMTYIRYRGSYNNTRLIPVDTAVVIPRGTADTFITYFSPANKFEFVNTMGEQAYSFIYRDQKDSNVTIETESNFMNLVRRPQAVVKLTKA